MDDVPYKTEKNILYKRIEEKEALRVKESILEYIKWLNRGLSSQNANEKLEILSDKYNEGGDMFIVATEDNNIIGYIGLKKLDDKTCEMIKLFVDDKYKGKGIEQTLVEKIIKEAKIKRYEKMRLNTSKAMKVALEICDKNGFHEIEPYCNDSDAMLIYLEKEL
ncbi:MAG: GNAT family N-acetyltransferase [Bacteroidales bacterium]|jgi:N-acetylglutamate synthase-like GNAT family acetyltransferase|nr:GNAT family N-acetyltransferase [Bacteroidales bacterium]